MLRRIRQAVALKPPRDCWRITYNGVIFPTDVRIFSPRILTAFERGRYENDEAEMLKRVLEPGERVLELGAGLGYISTLCARSEKVESVVTVEGNPELRQYIQTVHQWNNVADRVKLYSGIAVPAPSVPELTFYVRDDFWGSSLDGKAWRYTSTVQVPTLDLNQIIRDHRPTFLIIDIEGGEVDLFDGAELVGVTRIMMELHQEVIGRAGVKRVFDLLSDRGFHYDENHSCGQQLLFAHIEHPLPCRGTLPKLPGGPQS